MQKNKKTISMIVCAVVLIAISFYAGDKYALAHKGQTAQNGVRNSFTQGNFGGGVNGGVRGNGGSRGAGFGGLASGEILSMDAQSITVKLRDGGSKIIFYTDKTPVTKTVDGAITDLAVGKEINAMGTANPDGSVSAQSIQIRPQIVVK